MDQWHLLAKIVTALTISKNAFQIFVFRGAGKLSYASRSVPSVSFDFCLLMVISNQPLKPRSMQFAYPSRQPGCIIVSLCLIIREKPLLNKTLQGGILDRKPLMQCCNISYY
jgi:hypothetical protein